MIYTIEKSVKNRDVKRKVMSFRLTRKIPLSKSEAKDIYCILEKRFAEDASGLVSIPRDVILQGSVLAEISIPALKKQKCSS